MKVKGDHCSEFPISNIYFTSFHCTGRDEVNNLTSLPMSGFIAQLVKHCTHIIEVMGSNPVEALIFFRLLPSNWKFTVLITLHFDINIVRRTKNILER